MKQKQDRDGNPKASKIAKNGAMGADHSKKVRNGKTSGRFTHEDKTDRGDNLAQREGKFPTPKGGINNGVIHEYEGGKGVKWRKR